MNVKWVQMREKLGLQFRDKIDIYIMANISLKRSHLNTFNNITYLVPHPEWHSKRLEVEENLRALKCLVIQ